MRDHYAETGTRDAENSSNENILFNLEKKVVYGLDLGTWAVNTLIRDRMFEMLAKVDTITAQ
ncbi:hypothetical protein N0V90_009091 [Kalmusia sp. IMI 367209]|nr:hypothetical protein N0V90_009091 [Kalmusia sp. IMI 367209]